MRVRATFRAGPTLLLPGMNGLGLAQAMAGLA